MSAEGAGRPREGVPTGDGRIPTGDEGDPTREVGGVGPGAVGDAVRGAAENPAQGPVEGQAPHGVPGAVRRGKGPTVGHTLGATPADLRIAGMQPMSGVDWPGHLVATLFLQGCPWSCPYCHNHEILDPRTPGAVGWEQVEDLLARRHGLLDGVVFSGGEATSQVPLGPAMERVRELGYRVGLHSAGAYPRHIRELLEAGLVDWIGLDVKAMPDDYAEVAGPASAGAKAWASLCIVAGHPEVDHEVRITVYPGGPVDALAIAREARDLGIHSLALQQARALGAPAGFSAGAVGWDDQVRAMARDIEALGFDTFTFRPA